MKSGPTLKPWTASPRRRNASNRPSVTVVLPTPLATPATIRRRVGPSPGRVSLAQRRRRARGACAKSLKGGREKWWAGRGLTRRHQDFQTRPRHTPRTDDPSSSVMTRNLSRRRSHLTLPDQDGRLGMPRANSDPLSLDTGLTSHHGDQGGRHGEEGAEADDSAGGGAGGQWGRELPERWSVQRKAEV